MATLTPGELLGVLKENNTQFRDANCCNLQRQQLPRPDGRSIKRQWGYRTTKTWTTLGMRMTAKHRPGRTCFPPEDVKHAGMAVGLRWRIGWPTPSPLGH